MNPAIQWLSDALDAVNLDKAKGPQNKLDKDHILGPMSDDLKRIFVAITDKTNEVEKITLEMEHLEIDARREKSKQKEYNAKGFELSKLRSQMKALDGIFWAQVQTEFANKAPEGTYGFVGCADWSIGYLDNPDNMIVVKMGSIKIGS